MKALVLTGRTFGRLTVIRRAPSKRQRAHWLCACTCGNAKAVRSDRLIQGRTVSCGACPKLTMPKPMKEPKPPREPKQKKQRDPKKVIGRADRELERSMALAQRYGSWRSELTGMDLLPGEPRAAFGEQDAAKAVA